MLVIDRVEDGGDGSVRFVWNDAPLDPDVDGAGNNSGEIHVSRGAILGFYEMMNGTGVVGDDEFGVSNKGIPFFMDMLNTFTTIFAEEFNMLNDHPGGGPLFVSIDGEPLSARNIRISDEWNRDSLFLVRPGADEDNPDIPGEARAVNILAFIDALQTTNREVTDASGRTFRGSIMGYIVSMNSELSIATQSNAKNLAMSDGLLLSIDNMRESVKGVSEDEETVNLMKYTKSYSAAARFMTTLDEMVDIIVNRMGLVGR
jgi:flagellar hook-associated protein 1 FlgK